MAKRKDATNEFLAGIGENIRKNRKKKGYSLDGMGQEVGLDKGNMHHIEAGKNITLATLFKIARVLDVPASKLLHISAKSGAKKNAPAKKKAVKRKR